MLHTSIGSRYNTVLKSFAHSIWLMVPVCSFREATQDPLATLNNFKEEAPAWHSSKAESPDHLTTYKTKQNAVESIHKDKGQKRENSIGKYSVVPLTLTKSEHSNLNAFRSVSLYLKST